MIRYRVKNRKGAQVGEYELDDSMSPPLLNGFTVEVLNAADEGRRVDGSVPTAKAETQPAAGQAGSATPISAMTPPQVVAAPTQAAAPAQLVT